MQTSKKTMLAAVLAVAVVALAGVGYAISHTAETTNANNTMKTSYTLLAQDGTAAYTNNFLKDITFDTVNTADGVNSFKVKADYAADNDNNPTTFSAGSTYVLASNQLHLTVTPTNETAESFGLVVTVDNFTPTQGFTYTMVLGSAPDNSGAISVTKSVAYNTSTHKWDFGSMNFGGENKTEAVSYYVYLFISGEANSNATGFPVTGNHDGEGETELKSTFTFTATIA